MDVRNNRPDVLLVKILGFILDLIELMASMQINYALSVKICSIHIDKLSLESQEFSLENGGLV